MFKRVAE
jgi:tubulin beta